MLGGVFLHELLHLDVHVQGIKSHPPLFSGFLQDMREVLTMSMLIDASDSLLYPFLNTCRPLQRVQQTLNPNAARIFPPQDIWSEVFLANACQGASTRSGPQAFSERFRADNK